MDRWSTDRENQVNQRTAPLLQVCQELESKAGMEEVRRVVKDQSIINASLCADMSLARWLWKSAKTKQGGAVPWNVEALNSDPENFLWEKDKVGAVLHVVSRLLRFDPSVLLKRPSGFRRQIVCCCVWAPLPGRLQRSSVTSITSCTAS
jgi:hypothetical protein